MTDEIKDQNQEQEEEGIGTESASNDFPWPVFLVFVAFAVVIVVGVYAQTNGFYLDKTVPEPYKSQIVTLRDRNIAISEQQQELQKKIQDLQNEADFNQRRMSTLALQAMSSKGLSCQEWTLNTDTLKIVHHK